MDFKDVLWRVMLAGLLAGGLIMLFVGWRMLPPSRMRLVAVEQTAPVSVRREIVTAQQRRGHTHTPTQRVGLNLPGTGPATLSPPLGLWIEDLDALPRGQRIRFLVSPSQSTIYEVTTGDRTLLRYAAAADRQDAGGRARLLVGLVLAAIGAGNLAYLRWKARQDAEGSLV
ncbi:MAG TPA: hypothetical protein VIL65_04580 [Beijerinckiaceae bacterium]|jgi:hypothetical protein